ncbi:DUF2017 domain-containing protein [Streptomyces sp. GC420]|uniref:DUF2017 domain-containing protein n=1 Tax=Streptomyces sp. GC420 TaxID=2697568 RepID=UPI001414EEFA|nr:DUF2017 domain-containing protein [Streptomyces sp. GC420]NBM17355.1 DUF2017 family protein [Streptomyces sp. GC420]
MPGHFEAVPGGGAAVALDEVEISILRSLAVQLLELIGPGDEPAQGEDPLAALFAEGPSEPPEDPALARLFPDAYAGPDDDAEGDGAEERRALSAEFRRFTETDLRSRKREDALAVVRSLDGLGPRAAGGGAAVLKLSPDDSRQWLGALNDLRLAIGARLEVTDDESDELYRLPDSDPRKPMVLAYLWLGALQETLVETLMP